VLATILSHRSVRGFLPDGLPDGTLELLIAAAQSASTSSNLQFWSVVAVQDPERKSRLDRIAAEHQAQVDGTHYLEEFIVGVVDASLAAQSALIAAQSLGLGAVYVGAVRNLPEQIAAELALPSHVFAVFGMSIGYPDPTKETGIKPRLPQSLVLHREQYSAAQQGDAVDGYNATMRAFQREQGMRPIDWTQQCFNRVKDAEALRGRHRIREALRNLGFELR